jgi:hypothetical protein
MIGRGPKAVNRVVTPSASPQFKVIKKLYLAERNSRRRHLRPANPLAVVFFLESSQQDSVNRTDILCGGAACPYDTAIT